MNDEVKPKGFRAVESGASSNASLASPSVDGTSIGNSSEESQVLDSEEIENSQESAFRGNFTHALDSKGRISLPAEFRKVLESQFETSVVLTNYISDGARCLEGFSLKAWEAFEGKLREKSRFSAKLQQLENFYLSRSARCVMDGSGRILIPQHLRSYAGLEKDVTFTSSIHGFRVWDSRVWDHVFQQAEQALMSNPDLFADVDL